MLMELIRRLLGFLPEPPPRTVEQRLEDAIEVLLAEWEKNIQDPSTHAINAVNNGKDDPATRRDAARIEEYMRTAGTVWSRRLDQRAGIITYRPKEDSWCGFFVGYGLAVGGGLKPSIAEFVMPSTFRLNSKERWEKANATQAQRIDPKDIRRGDIVVVETSRKLEYGDHITMALGPPDEHGMVDTVEGNATGRFPDDIRRRAQGVVRQRRHLNKVRRVWRLGPEHFDG